MSPSNRLIDNNNNNSNSNSKNAVVVRTRLAQAFERGDLVQTLLRGWSVAYGRGIPSAAITVTSYTMIKDQLAIHLGD